MYVVNYWSVIVAKPYSSAYIRYEIKQYVFVKLTEIQK